MFFRFFNVKVCCVFSLESPHRGDSNEYTKYTIFNTNKKNILNYPKSAAMGSFPRTQEGVQNSRGKQANSVRAIEVLLYLDIIGELSTFSVFHVSSIYTVDSVPLCLDA